MSRFARWLRTSLAWLSALAVFAIGIVTLVVGEEVDPFGRSPVMAPGIPCTMMALAAALACLTHGGRRAVVVGRSLAWAALLVGFYAAAESALPFDLPFEGVVRELGCRSSDCISWRPLTSVCVVLLATALLSFDRETRLRRKPSEFLALAVLFIGIVVLSGYIYDVKSLTDQVDHNALAMSFRTSISFIILSVGTMCALPGANLVAMLSSALPGGMVARRLIMAAFLLPLVGAIVMAGQHATLYGSSTSGVLLSVSAMAGAMILVAATARTLDRTDLERRWRLEELSRWKAMFDEADWGAVLSDDGGRIVVANAAYARMHGYEAGELEGQPIDVLLAPARPGDSADRTERRRARGHMRFEVDHRRKDGSTFPVIVDATSVRDAAGRPLYSVDYVQDMTEVRAAEQAQASFRKKAEEDLRASEERYRILFEQVSEERLRLQAILDQMPDGVVVVDSEGALVARNRAADALSAAPPGVEPSPSAVRMDLRDASGRPLAVDEEPLNRLLRLGAPTKARELVVMLRDGREVPILVSAAEVKSPRGSLIGAVATFQDISPLKELERMREEWASVVAHDLRQPLHGIELNVQLLARSLGKQGVLGSDDGQTGRAIGRIHKAVSQLERMIRDLSDLSRIEARRLTLQIEARNIEEVAKEVVDRFSSDAPLESVVEGEPRLVCCDSDRVDQVLSNLITNAIKYGEPKGTIVVGVEYRGSEVACFVRNRGKGIEPEELDRVFSRFERARTASGIRGLGLGLYICRGLVEAHGGKIGVESVVGGETTFFFTLPYEPVIDTGEGRVSGA